MATFKGYDVLEVEPSRRPGRNDEFRSRFVLLDSRTGKKRSDVRSSDGVVTMAFEWYAEGRTQIQALRTFLEARRGRAVPVWVPTYDADLVLASDALVGGSGLSIRWSGYSKHLFKHPARRTIQIFNRDTWAREYARITNATEAGALETLALESPLTVGGTVAAGLVSFLYLCRLAADETVITHHSPELATATIRLAELPKEIPS